VKADLRSLEEIGNHLDMKLPNVQRRQGKEEIVLSAPTVRDLLMYDYLKIRDKNRRLLPLLANRAQREYKRRRRQRNEPVWQIALARSRPGATKPREPRPWLGGLVGRLRAQNATWGDVARLSAKRHGHAFPENRRKTLTRQ